MDYIEIIGLAAATITTAGFVPQVYKIWRKRSTQDISLNMYLLLSAGLSLWIVYGFSIESLPVILANSITLLLVICIIVLKLKFN